MSVIQVMVSNSNAGGSVRTIITLFVIKPTFLALLEFSAGQMHGSLYTSVYMSSCTYVYVN